MRHIIVILLALAVLLDCCSNESLAQIKKSVEMILESITDNFIAFDSQWRITAFNKHTKEQLKTLGKNPVGFVGKVVWDEFPNAPLEEALRRAMDERAAIVHEDYYPQIEEWDENRIYPSKDGGLAVFQRYVTARKQAEENLRRSEAYLAEGERLSGTGSGAWNILTGEVFWSREMYRIYGFEPESVKPSAELFFGIVHTEDCSRVEQIFERAMRERSGCELEFRVVRPEGIIKHLHSVNHPVFDESGELTEIIGTILDITERKRAEEKLREEIEERKRVEADRERLLRRIVHAQEDEQQRIAREMHEGRVIAIDCVPERLEMAEKEGKAEIINFENVDVYNRLQEMTNGRGPDSCIDAVGCEALAGGKVDGVLDAVKTATFMATDRVHVIRQAIMSCRKGGTLSMPGVCVGAGDKIPIGSFMNKGLTWKTGQTHMQKYMPMLLEKIQNGEIDPSFIITHEMSLDDAAKGYEMFKHKQDSCIKSC